MRPRHWTAQAGIHLALAVGAVAILAPFGWMVMGAFTPQDQIFRDELLPDAFTFANFAEVFEEVPMLRYYLNSFVAAATIFVLQVIVCLPAAYALARLRFRGRELSLWIVLACLMVPTQVAAIPIYLMFSRVGILDTFPSLVLPFVSSAFGIFLLRQFILTIPQSVFDAARLDGARAWSTLTRVVFPLVKPALVSFGVFSFVSHWNDYFWPSVVLRSTDYATVPYGIVRFVSFESGTSYGAQMAAALLAIAPLLLGFLLAQRQFIAGFSIVSD
ncbi:carbohydrate ABC transporter permease [Marinactinospora rubrisoli]|uniref:Carbohydrate ABC transporter permease n=1 Tax=Marinactinospora rubrisoli TaxID=2715399 RepID=A0ABW2KFT4_9ACTN